jgi:cellulose 1,4-beta-cellobiosidase
MYEVGTNIGSRLYLLDSTDANYQLFKLLNQEFTFDVDLTTLPCGLNGALYFTNMAANGNLGVGNNGAGAKFGTGYCDAQCPADIKFINGAANFGTEGPCCSEFDIWEANTISSAYTSHSCANVGLTACTTNATCGWGSANRYTGNCDMDGCDWNPYRMGDQTFYGPGMTIDTTKTMTIVTQFITSDGTATGTLSQVVRKYVQNGIVYSTPESSYIPFNSVSDASCAATKVAFANTAYQQGGLEQMTKVMAEGMVLVMSLWDDTAVGMVWLDSLDPTNGSASTPGVARGTCSTTSGDVTTDRADYPNAYVTYSNIKVGDIGSTFSGTAASSSTTAATTTTTAKATTTTTKAATTTTKATTTTAKATTTTTKAATTTTTTKAATTTTASNCSTKWGQCGGIGWTGPTCCVASTCTPQAGNPYYSQCL